MVMSGGVEGEGLLLQLETAIAPIAERQSSIGYFMKWIEIILSASHKTG
jgi:hypothetical protein